MVHYNQSIHITMCLLRKRDIINNARSLVLCSVFVLYLLTIVLSVLLLTIVLSVLLLTIVLSVLRSTDSDYPFGIFKIFFSEDKLLVCVYTLPTNKTSRKEAPTSTQIDHLQFHHVYAFIYMYITVNIPKII